MTLIELIVVMGLMATVLALSAPALSRFTIARKLDDEARRMLALTRYGRSEAVSRGVPMELWIDLEQNAYGLRPQSGYGSAESRPPVEFRISDGLTLEIAEQKRNTKTPGAILFWPDGAIDEDSLPRVTLRDDRDGGWRRIALADSGLEYALETTDER